MHKTGAAPNAHRNFTLDARWGLKREPVLDTDTVQERGPAWRNKTAYPGIAQSVRQRALPVWVWLHVADCSPERGWMGAFRAWVDARNGRVAVCGCVRTGDWSRAGSRTRLACILAPPRCSVRLHAVPFFTHRDKAKRQHLAKDQTHTAMCGCIKERRRRRRERPSRTCGPTIIPRTASTGMFSSICPFTAKSTSPICTCPDLHIPDTAVTTCVGGVRVVATPLHVVPPRDAR